jgi:uncharacterized protein (UPF0276 family)
VGLGFRAELASELLASSAPDVRWVEIHPENYLGRGGRFAAHLETALSRWPVVTHGLSLCVGATDPFEPGYVRALKSLLRRVGARWHSEHLAWGNVGPAFAHDLLPLPFTDEAIAVAVARIRELRDALEVDLAIENTSFYAHPGGRGATTEIEFLLEVLERADCKLLLDVNNVFVNATNHGFDAAAFLARVPMERVVQLHVAGHFVRSDGLVIDTHGAAVRTEVLALLEDTLRRLPPGVPILLERDLDHPPLPVLEDELRALAAIAARAETGR